MLILNHSAISGTTIEGDQTREAKDHIKKLGLKWSPTRIAWYKLKSLGQTDKMQIEKWLNYYKYHLEKAGFQCQINIEVQTQDEIDESLKNIYENKIERYENLSESKIIESNKLCVEAMNMVKQTACTPILIGHHSEGRHRRWLERSDNKLRKAVENDKASKYYKDKVETFKEKIEIINCRAQVEARKNQYEEILLKFKKETKKTLKLDRFIMVRKFAHQVWYFAKKNDKTLRIILNDQCELQIEDYKFNRDSIVNYENVAYLEVVDKVNLFLNAS